MLDTLIELAKEAGEEILKVKKGSLEVTRKADGSPLTLADQRSNQVIGSGLKKLAPEIPLISEENRQIDFEERKDWKEFWLVDPLDGTKEFLKGLPEYTVNIGLIRDGVPVLGVIYAPEKHWLYYGSEAGSFRVRDQSKEQIFSTLSQIGDEITILESRSHRQGPDPAESFRIKKRLHIGSSLKFCLLAEGTADIYFRSAPTCEWDVAAGDCIYRNSAQTGQHPSPLLYNKKDLKNGPFVLGIQKTDVL